MEKFSKEFYASRIEDWITKYIKLKELCKLIKTIKRDIEKNGGQIIRKSERFSIANLEESQRPTLTTPLDRHSVGLSALEDPDGLFNKNQKIFNTPLMFEINEMFTEIENLEYGDDIKIFLYFLTIEVHNVYVFYLSIEKNIFMRVNEHSYNRKKYKSFTEQELLEELTDLTDITYLLYSFYSYIDLNVKAVQEILKYFDDHFQILNHNICMNNLYFKKYLNKKESDLKYILSFKIIIESCALIESYYQEIVKLSNSKEIKEQKKELKEVLSYLNEKDTDRVNDDIHEVYLKQKDLHINNIIKQKKNIKIDIQNSYCVDVHQQEDFYKRLGEKEYDEEIRIKTTPKNMHNLIFLYFHMFIYSFFYIMPYLVFYFFFVQNKINIYYIGFILTSTHLGNFVSKIVINYFSEKYKIKFIFFCICFILSFILSIYSEKFMQKEVEEIDEKNFFIFNLASRFIFGFSCGRLLTRKYIVQFLPESEIKFFSLVYIIIIYVGILSGIVINFILKDMKPLYIGILALYVKNYFFVFLIGAITSLIYLILIIIIFTEPTEATMLRQYRTFSEHKVKFDEDEDKRESITEEKNICDYKELYDENETGDETRKLNKLIIKSYNENSRKTNTDNDNNDDNDNDNENEDNDNNDENDNENYEEIFDERTSSKRMTMNLLESKEEEKKDKNDNNNNIIENNENDNEKEPDFLSTPLNISSIRNKESKNETNLELSSNFMKTSNSNSNSNRNSNTNSNRISNNIIKDVKNNNNNNNNGEELMSAEEIKGLNSIEKELINMNEKNNFDDVNLMPNELERIRKNHYKNNSNYLCSFLVFVSILLLTTSLNEFILLSIPLCFLYKGEFGVLYLSEKDVILMVMALQIFSFPFLIFVRMMKAFNVERRLLLIFYAVLFGLMCIFLFLNLLNYIKLEDNIDINLFETKNVLYRMGIVLVFIISNLIEGATHLLSNKIIPSFVKFCKINNKYIISYSTVFGKIIGGLIFSLICLFDEHNTFFQNTKVYKYNIILFSSLTIILFSLFIISYKRLRIRAISKLFFISD